MTEDAIALEEAIAKQCQRLFRQHLLPGVGVVIGEDVFHDGDRRHLLNRDIAALEVHRTSQGTAAEAFYLGLLRLRPADRAGVVVAATRSLGVQRPGDAR